MTKALENAAALRTYQATRPTWLDFMTESQKADVLSRSAMTNVAAPVQRAVDEAIKRGVELLCPGRARLESNITGRGLLTICGHAPESSEWVFVGDKNLTYSDVAAEYNSPQFTLRNIGFRTVGINGTPGVIHSKWTGGVGSTASTAMFDNIEVTGADGASGFSTGLHLENTRNVGLRRIRIMGDRSSGVVASGEGIKISGDASPVEINLDDVRAYFVNTALSVTGTAEGVYVDKCAFVAVKNGINWQATGAKPLLSVHGSHINATQTCINGIDLVQAILMGNLFYIQNFSNLASSAASAVQLDLNVAGTDLASIISNNVFYYLSGAPAKNGLVVLPGAGNETLAVENNIFASFDSGIVLENGSNGVVVGNTNRYLNCTVKVTDNGANRVEPSTPYMATKVVTMENGSATSRHDLPLPSGLLSGKPQSVMFSQADNPDIPLHFTYLYGDAGSTATNIVVVLRRNDGLPFTGGAMRISYAAI